MSNKDEYRKQVRRIVRQIASLESKGFTFPEDILPDEEPARVRKQDIEKLKQLTLQTLKQKAVPRNTVQIEPIKPARAKAVEETTVTTKMPFSRKPSSKTRARKLEDETVEQEKAQKQLTRRTRKEHKKYERVEAFTSNGEFIEAPRSVTEGIDHFIKRAKDGFKFVDPETGEIVDFKGTDFNDYVINTRYSGKADDYAKQFKWYDTLDNFIEQNPELENFIRAKFPLYNNHVNNMILKEYNGDYDNSPQDFSVADLGVMDDIIISNFRSQLVQVENALAGTGKEFIVHIAYNWLDRIIGDNGKHDTAVMIEEGAKNGKIVRIEIFYNQQDTTDFLESLTTFLPDQGDEYLNGISEALEIGEFNEY